MVLIQNIIETSSDEDTYDIFVETTDSSKEIMEFYLKSIKEKPNFSLRFIDHSHLLINSQNHTGRWGLAVLYRLLIPETFQAYEKVLSLDADLLILKDIKLITKIDIENYYLAVSRDYTTSLIFKNPAEPTKNPFKIKIDSCEYALIDYFNTYLDFTPIEMQSYFNVGIMLFNIKKTREKENQLKGFLENSTIKYFFPRTRYI